jgi:hypothetical protein
MASAAWPGATAASTPRARVCANADDFSPARAWRYDRGVVPNPRPLSKKPEVRLNPNVQARLLEQMREEQAAALRARRIKLFVLLPAVIGVTVWSGFAAFSPDQTTAMLGNLVGSSLLLLFWKLRKRIAASVGLG